MNKINVKPGSERWNQLVAIGIVKDADRNWFLGDAALEIAPATWDNMLDGPPTPAIYPGEEALLTLHRYADDIGIDHHRLSVYRQTAAYWPKESRVEGTSWKVHQMLTRQQKLIKPKMTVTQAHEALGHSIDGRGGLVNSLDHARDQLTRTDFERQRQERHEAILTTRLSDRERRDDLAPRVEWIANVLAGVRREMAQTRGLTPAHRQRIHAAALQVGQELVELVRANGVGEISVQQKQTEGV